MFLLTTKAKTLTRLNAFCLSLLFWCFGVMLHSQQKRVSGTGSVIMNDPSKTKLVYEQEALEAARMNALNAAFGSSVLSNYEQLTYTEMEGSSVSGHQQLRNNYLNSFPNGVWIGYRSKQCYEEKDEKGNFWMTCEVKGNARKINTPEVRFKAWPMDGTDPEKDQTTNFISGESTYLYFKSAEDGYIIVFFDDLKEIQRCMPYNASNENCLPVEANKDYIFFSPEHNDYTHQLDIVDEVELYTNKTLEYNQFYIVFSPEPFRGYFLEPSKKLEDGYTGFKTMKKADFHAWLQDNRRHNDLMQVQVIGVSIKNPGI